MHKFPVKDPAAVLDYVFDWSAYYLASGETVSSYTVTVHNATLDSSSEASGVITAWISGGTAGKPATVVCRIVTSAGRTDERTGVIKVAHR